MDTESKILEEDEKCPLCDDGLMEVFIKNCSCHINPPCSSCTDAPLVCNVCGHYQTADLYNPPVTNSEVLQFQDYKTHEQELEEIQDGTFGFIKYPSPDGWGMTVEGKMPGGMKKEQVLTACSVDKHGLPQFKHFCSGTFLFTYNYD